MCRVLESKKMNEKVKEIFKKIENPLEALKEIFNEEFFRVDLSTRECFRAKNFLIEKGEDGYVDIIYGTDSEIDEEVANLRFGELLLKCIL